MKKLILIYFLLPIALLLNACTYVSQGIFVDANRHAAINPTDIFGDQIERIVYPDQNWDSADSLWFYTTSQGSNLMPYEMFLHLEQAENDELFRSKSNMDYFRYLPQEPSISNPDGLPVGWVKDNHRGKNYIGFTCAACHTAQINYQGVGIRIDGGPPMADMELMLAKLESALKATRDNPAKFERLAKNILGRKHPEGAEVLRTELQRVTAELTHYNRINAPRHGSKDVRYGYARLDAFGRIYNRVLAHLTPEEENFNPPNAPVSYPQLWDTPLHDFVQWNGVGDNSFAGPLGRNTGEVVGVFATMDLNKKKNDIGYRSSVMVRNLNRIELHLEDLWSPRWDDLAEQNVLPPINSELANQGLLVFVDYHCHTCHEVMDRQDPDRRIIAQFSSLKAIGTDPTMAMNALSYSGKSGFFEGQRPLKPTLKTFEPKTLALPAVSEAATGVILEPDHDKTFIRRWGEKFYDLFASLSENPIKTTTRMVDFQIVDKDDPKTLAAYKARPLNGIWATAPYLHNGSVPSLYELFLPSCTDAEIESGKRCRPNRFTLGSRELDPVNVGYIQRDPDQYPDLFIFNTRLPSNSNKGHEYAAGNTPVYTLDKNGNILKDAQGKPIMTRLPPINHEQRMALVEYLKTL